MRAFSTPKSFLLGRWLLLLLVATLSSCGFFNNDDDPQPPTVPGGQQLFVSADLVVTLPKTTLQLLAANGGYAAFVPLLKYDVQFYKFLYKTTYQGREIQASGLLCVPQNTATPPALLSAQHGTIFRQADAPSNFPGSFTGFELTASLGFATVIPDYVGFGASRDIFHPYYDAESSGRAVVDMVKAAQYYLGQRQITLNNKLFLLGYSEGGYVTLAAQKEIETTPAHNLALTGSLAGAGGYDLTGVLNFIATTPTYDNPSFLAYILQAYNKTYTWNRPLTDFFREPYATNIPGLLDGTKDINAVNAGLTNSPAALFAPTFYANLSNPAGELTLKRQLVANSFPDWRPTAPTRLYHGTADEKVPFQTSVTTVARFQAAGAPQLTFVPIPGGTHETSVQPMLLDAVPWINALNQ